MKLALGGAEALKNGTPICSGNFNTTKGFQVLKSRIKYSFKIKKIRYRNNPPGIGLICIKTLCSGGGTK